MAHDNKKPELLQWALHNRQILGRHDLVATGTTGTLLTYELGLAVTRLLSGPVGGDLQVGTRIAEGLIDLLVSPGTPSSRSPTTRTSRPCCG